MLLFLVALIVLGPARLPEAARTVGKVVGELRRLSGDFRSEMRDAIFDPVDGTREALSPSAWVADATSPPLASPATTPSDASTTLTAPRSGPLLPLPDDPSLN